VGQTEGVKHLLGLDHHDHHGLLYLHANLLLDLRKTPWTEDWGWWAVSCPFCG
jgi:hypothetical protein